MERNLEKRVEKLENEVRKIKGVKPIISIKKQFQIGDTFELIGMNWIILDITEKGYVVRTVDLWESDIQFDTESNNWENSSLRKVLNNEFYNELANAIGEENIIPFERGLTSLDGQTEYGTCEDKVSMISVDEYRKYRKLLKNPDDWTWMITPDSTKCNGDEKWVNVVSPLGDVGIMSCDDYNGVRPFCIFSSSIFESEE